jgi:hypothetical protein
MTILVVAQSINDYCSSNLQSFTGYIPGDTLLASTTAGTFDSTSVTYALTIYNSFSVRAIKKIPAGQTLLWLHVMYYTTPVVQSSTVPDSITFTSDDETPLIRVNKTTGSATVYQVQLLQGGSTVTLAGTFSMASNTLKELDIKWLSHVSTGNIEIYDGQTLVYTFTGNTTVDADVRFVVFGGSNAAGSATDAVRVSEVIVADEPTLRMKLRNLKVSSVDSATNWTTTLGKVIETTGGVSIVAASPGNFSTSPGSILFNMTDIPAADAAKRVRGVYVTQFMSRTGSTPIANTRTIVDIAGTVYESSDHALFGGSDNVQIEFLLNPSTGQAWTPTEVNAAKVGVKSV